MFELKILRDRLQNLCVEDGDPQEIDEVFQQILVLEKEIKESNLPKPSE